jgi:Mce-associated membrane protein
VSEKDEIIDGTGDENGAGEPNIDPEAKDTGAGDAEVADSDIEQVESEEVEGDEKPAGGDVGGAKRSRRPVRTLVSAALLAVALLASAGMAGWLYFNDYRPDQQTDPAASQVALDAAKTGTVALLSYSPDSLDQDFANAKSKLTGDFLSYYTQFTEQIVTPAAREKSVKTAASVVRAAVSEIEPDSAEVLVFINQTTTSKENPDGAFAASSVKVGMTKIDGTWLIESFDPV